jgi:hypothetical protein
MIEITFNASHAPTNAKTSICFEIIRAKIPHESERNRLLIDGIGVNTERIVRLRWDPSPVPPLFTVAESVHLYGSEVLVGVLPVRFVAVIFFVRVHVVKHLHNEITKNKGTENGA